MVETTTTNINKFRQKRLKLKGLAGKQKDITPINSYFYPRNELYTREEFELLDTIYSDEPSIEEKKEINPEITNSENFWPQNKEAYLSVANNKNSFLANLSWFLGGVALTSVIWLIYFQVNVHEIRTKSDTQIIFQKSANIMTDKTVDKELSKQLKDKKVVEAKINASSVPKENVISRYFTNLFSKNPSKTQILSELPKIESVKFYTVASGDSLWIIANKYYSNPSPDNINKIMKANNMKRIGTLSVGQKLVVPQ